MPFEPHSTPKPRSALAVTRPPGRALHGLDRYFAGSFANAPLGADDELERACELRRLRIDLWRELLSLPTARPAIRAAVRELSPPGTDTRWLEGLDDVTADLAAIGLQLVACDPDRALVERVFERVFEPVVAEVDAARESSSTTTASSTARARIRSARRAWLRARNDFACHYLKFVGKIAAQLGRTSWPVEDRIQEGNLGLLKAVDRFDPDRGCRFTTFASWWIRHAIIRGLVNRARTVRVPSHLHVVFVKAGRARRAFAQRGEQPTLDELAAAIGEPPSRVEMAEDAMRLHTVGLDAPSSSHASVQDELPEHIDRDWLADLDGHRDATVARQGWDCLDALEREILERRFGLAGTPTATLQAIGAAHGRSHEWIRQLQNRALGKLRARIESSPLTTMQVCRAG